MSSRSFGNARPVRSHLLRPGGVRGEVLDARNDVEAAFSSLEGEVDTIHPYVDTGAAKIAAFNAVIDGYYQLNPTAGGFAVTLPSAAGLKNRGITFKNVSASVNAVTFDADGTETIDANAGTSATSLATAWGTVTLISNGVDGWDRHPAE